MHNENNTAIRLPIDRVEQLRLLSEALGGKTFSYTIGQMLDAVRKQGLIKHGIPSVALNRFPDGVAVQVKGCEPTGFAFETIASLASDVRACLEIGYNGQPQKCSKENGSYRIHTKGTAVGVSIPAEAEPKFFNPDLALEFAELLEATLPKVN